MHLQKFLLALIVVAISTSVFADDTAELRKKIMMDQKKLIIMDNMEFTEEEAQAFWPVFDKHQESLFQVNQRGAKLILAYASVYQSMTDEQATQLIDEYFDIQDDRLMVMKKMMLDVEKVLPGKKAFRYMQIEAKLAAIGRYELAKEIPLAQ
ncbi:MAG: hypothetical protein JRF07_01350 [Deltaproteobacteria bacterium]|jgi:hypothetical protein|nr:hypothetical protein [Deltaproteobacteria bacterium]MBW2476038.1 hypothetical protein [Deltaproteobacteria bacterium]MBW2520024.1 hypothetical protein [Deltaproteobacteria bacterium]